MSVTTIRQTSYGYLLYHNGNKVGVEKCDGHTIKTVLKCTTVKVEGAK